MSKSITRNSREPEARFNPRDKIVDLTIDHEGVIITPHLIRAISWITTMSPAVISSRFAASGFSTCVCTDCFKPASWFIWEQIRDWFDFRIKKSGVRNCAFPLFVSEDVLQKEKAHIEGFAAEVAWVTHA